MVSESAGRITLDIVSTPAARPVEISVITQDDGAVGDVGKSLRTYNNWFED